MVRRITTSSTTDMKRAPSAKPGSTLGNKRSSNAQDTLRYRLTATTSPTRSNSKTVAVDSFAGIPQAKTATAMAATPPNDVLEKPMMTAPAVIAANSGQPNVAIRAGTRRLYWVVRTRWVVRTDPDAGVRCPVSGVCARLVPDNRGNTPGQRGRGCYVERTASLGRPRRDARLEVENADVPMGCRQSSNRSNFSRSRSRVWRLETDW